MIIMKSPHNFAGDFQSHHKLITEKRKYSACLAKLSSLLEKIQWVSEVLKHEIETLEKGTEKIQHMSNFDLRVFSN